MGFIKRYAKEKMGEIKQTMAANAIIKKKERAAYLKAKEEESVKLAKSKAAYDAKEQLKVYKEKKKGGGFFASLSKGSAGSSPGLSSMLMDGKKKKGKPGISNYKFY